jgi:hypothetical protein
MAAGEGFEPSQTESESGVLPLHKPAKARFIILTSMNSVKKKLKNSKKIVVERFGMLFLITYRMKGNGRIQVPVCGHSVI